MKKVSKTAKSTKSAKTALISQESSIQPNEFPRDIEGIVMSQTNYSDPTVTKTMEAINAAINNPKVIKPSGSIRVESKIKLEDDSLEVIEGEALSVTSIDKDKLEEIKRVASENPITKELMEEAKQFFVSNKDKVGKQMRDLVALYNIKDEKPFFFISPSEARLAIDYIKKVRCGFIQDEKDYKIKDAKVRNFILNYDYCMANCIELKDNRRGMSSGCYSRDEDSATVEISLNVLNRMFAIVEASDLMVDILIMDANRWADIRNMGKTVYNEATVKEVKERGIMGRLWTADVYLCNKVGSDCVILGSSDHGVFVRNRMAIREVRGN